MEDKFNINTLFRTVIPGYVCILVVSTLKPDLFYGWKDATAILALAGVPLGYLAYSIHRALLYLFCGEDLLNKADFIHIVENKKIRRKIDENKGIKDFTEEDRFYYAVSIDYFLTDPYVPKKNLEDLNAHLCFLYTRMHSSFSIVVAIISPIFLMFILGMLAELRQTCAFIVLWIIAVILFCYLGVATGKRIAWWRRTVIDNNLTSITNILRPQDS